MTLFSTLSSFVSFTPSFSPAARRLVLSVGLALPLAACAGGTGDDADDPVCTPGAQSECSCAGDSTGFQVCNEDGSGLGSCQCDGSGDNGGNNGGGDNGGNNGGGDNGGNNGGNNGGGDNGGGNNGGGNNGGGNNGGGDNTPDAWCCLDDAFYSCPTENDAYNCALSFDASACTRDASFDGTCQDNGGGNNGGGNNGGGNNGGGNNGGGNNGGGDNLPAENAICYGDSDCAPQQTGMICVVDNAGDTQGQCHIVCEEHWDCNGLDRCCDVYGGTRVCGEEDSWPEGACD